MENLNKDCGCIDTCGCNSDILSLRPICSSPECANPEKCSETFSTDCIVYTGDTILDLGIPKGARLTDVLQILMNFAVNPGCASPNSPCISVVGFHSRTINQTTVIFDWSALVGTVSYQIQYRPVTSNTWLFNPATNNNFDTIGGLLPNTQYYVKVNTLCGANSCFSLTLLITTKP